MQDRDPSRALTDSAVPLSRYPLRALYPAKIAKNETGEIVSIRICRVKLDRPPEESKRLLTQPAVVEDLGEKEVKH